MEDDNACQVREGIFIMDLISLFCWKMLEEQSREAENVVVVYEKQDHYVSRFFFFLSDDMIEFFLKHFSFEI